VTDAPLGRESVQFYLESLPNANGVVVPVRFFARKLHDGPETFDYIARSSGEWGETDRLWESERGLNESTPVALSFEEAQAAATVLWGETAGQRVVSAALELPGEIA
jgi:hypothetical protein